MTDLCQIKEIAALIHLVDQEDDDGAAGGMPSLSVGWLH